VTPARPFGPAGVAAPAPLLRLASPLSRTLVIAVFATTFAALAVRMESPLWFAAPTTALLVGVGLGLRLDLRRWYVTVPGLAAAMLALVLVGSLGAVAVVSLEVDLPVALVPLTALAVFGADWWWVDRLRPTAVLTGVLLVPVLANDLGAALPLAVLWFGLLAAALWSLRRDAAEALPTPVPLDGSPVPTHEPGVGRTVLAVLAAWLVAGLVVALVGLVPTWFRSPEAPGRFGMSGSFDPGSGSVPGGGSGDIGPGATVDPGIQDGELRDVDGDGIPDRDIDGDGIPDVDLDGDRIPDIDANGDGIPDRDQGGAGGGDDGGGLPEAGAPPAPDDTTGVDGTDLDADGARSALRIAGIAVVVALVAVLLAALVAAVRRQLARRRALAARPWAVRLAERLEAEGARRGRARGRDEPVTRYADALAGGVLAHDHLAAVGVALSASLFGPTPAPDATGEWAGGVVDEAVAANPPPRWYDPVRDRLRRRRPGAEGRLAG
jgi:hypothetical protein